MLRLSCVIVFFLLLLTPISNAQRNPEWLLLGEQSVGFRVSHDIIKIGQSADWFSNRSFRAIYLVAERTDAHIISVRIVYLNGYAEDLRVDEYIRQGDQLALNLGGERSYLKQIELIYRVRPDFSGDASIKVFAER